MFGYGQFKCAQREKLPKPVWLKVLILGVSLGGMVWNLIYRGMCVGGGGVLNMGLYSAEMCSINLFKNIILFSIT